jgi:hypothetical protein
MSRPPLASAVPWVVGTGGLRRGTTSSGSSAMRERHSIDAQE